MAFERYGGGRPRPGGGPGAPAINLPKPVTQLLIACLIVQAITEFLSPGMLSLVYDVFGVVPIRYSEDLNPIWAPIVAPVTHTFLHGGWMHLGMNMLMLAAFGSGVAQVLSPRRFFAFYFLCGAAAAFVHVVVNPGSMAPLIGASGAIFGLFPAAILVLYGQGRLQARAVMPFVAVLVVLALLQGLDAFFGSGSNIAWVAHIAGIFAGLVLFPLIAGGIPRPGRR